MDDKNRDPFVDHLLDESLRHYQSEEPRAGVEGRILASVQSADGRARRVRWAWAIASAAVIVVVVVLLRSPRGREEPVTVSRQPEVTRPEAPEIAAPAPAPPVVRAKSFTRVRRAPARPKRPEQFPTPAPLSDEEKLLIAFVMQSPKPKLPIPIHGELKIEPLEIRELNVAPIEIKALPKLSE